jgi:hypothetical protein
MKTPEYGKHPITGPQTPADIIRAAKNKKK